MKKKNKVKNMDKGNNKDNNKDNAKKSDFDRYQSAASAWSDRVSQGRSQLNNWRMCALVSFFVTLLLIVSLVMVVSSRADKVYVAQVGPKESVQSVRLASTQLAANEVQKVYFVSEFINNIMTIPLDPIVLRDNWLKAYNMSMGKAQVSLTDYVRQNNPFSQVGNLTETVKIERFNPLGNNSFEVIWRRDSFEQSGKKNTTIRFSGVFTLQQFKVSSNLQQLLVNPFGLKIIFFSINRLGSVGA